MAFDSAFTGSNITLRSEKGSPLTHEELDCNFRVYFYSASFDDSAITFYRKTALDSELTLPYTPPIGRNYAIQIKRGNAASGSGAAFTGSHDLRYNWDDKILVVTGSGEFTQDVRVQGNVFVTGSVTATQFNTSIVSASVSYQSGSNKLGDTLDDKHEFTGSVDITGSITVRGDQTYIGNWVLDGDFEHTGSTFRSGSTSQAGDVSLTGKESITGSLTVSGSSTFTNIGKAIFTGQNTHTGDLTHTGTAAITGGLDVNGLTHLGHNTDSASLTLTGSFNLDGTGHTNRINTTVLSHTGSFRNLGSIQQTGGLTRDGSFQSRGNNLIFQVSQSGTLGIIRTYATQNLLYGNRYMYLTTLQVNGQGGSVPVATFNGDIIVTRNALTRNSFASSSALPSAASYRGNFGYLEDSGSFVAANGTKYVEIAELSQVNSNSSSFASQLSASEASLTSSLNAVSNSLALTISASEASLTSSLSSVSSSLAISISASEASLTSSINTISSSLAFDLSSSEARLTSSIDNLSSSLALSITNSSTGSINVSGSNTFNGSQIISGSITVLESSVFESVVSASSDVLIEGTLTANDVNVTNITASGDISSSGTIIANTFEGSTVNVTNITASGDISSSGTVIAAGIDSSGPITGSALRVENLSDFRGNVHITGSVFASADITAYHSSDIRLKENIQDLTSSLDVLSAIRGVQYDWNSEAQLEGSDYGVIAQEVEKVLPLVVKDREDGYKGVKYEKIIPVLINAINELKAEIEELKNR